MNETYQKQTDQLLNELESSPRGLSSAERKARQEKHGPNALAEGQKSSVFKIFLEQFADFLVIILLAAAVISAFLNDIQSMIVITFVLALNAVLGTVQTVKAEKSLDSLKKISAPSAKVLIGGEIVQIPSDQVTIGDVVVLEAGDYVCADGRILENASLKINESALTGESVPVEKDTAPIEGEVPLGDRKNMAYSGSFVTYGRGTLLVTDIGMNTEVGKIATLLKETKNQKTPLQVSLDDFGKKLSIAILALCAILFVVSILGDEPIIDAFMFAVALAVAAIPQALSSIVTIVLSFSTQRMVKENAIVRKLQAVEGLGSVSIICSDKTGTLTQNRMTVKECYVPGLRCTSEQINTETDLTMRKLVYSGVLCSDATTHEGQEIGDPTEIALINLATSNALSWADIRAEAPRTGELPFDSDRKLMSVVVNDKLMITKGAVDVLMHRVSKIETPDGPRPFTPADMKEIEGVNRAFSENGLRVLAFATKSVSSSALTLEDENDLTFLGLIAMQDPPRVESKEAVAKCILAGIRPVMITGDHKITASAIAREIGILQDGLIAMEGTELDSMTDEELKAQVDKVAVYARVSPEHKIRIVNAWQEKGFIVSMTGDGVNDAPALKQADVGVAMGITGTEVAKDAASMVLADDNFATIVKAIETGRNIYANIQKAIKYILAGNMGGILSVIYAFIAGVGTPFLATHLIFIDFLADSLPAIALGLDSDNGDVMKQKPRPKNETMLTRPFLIDVAVVGLIIGFCTMTAYHVGLCDDYAAATTMAFATLATCRLLLSYTMKSAKPILFTGTFWDNKFMNLSVIGGFVLLHIVLLVPPLATMFKIEPLNMFQMLTIYGCALLSLLLLQGINFLRSRKK